MTSQPQKPRLNSDAAQPQKLTTSQTATVCLNDFMLEVYNEPTQGLYWVNQHLEILGPKLLRIKFNLDDTCKNLRTALTDVMEDAEAVDKIIRSQLNFASPISPTVATSAQQSPKRAPVAALSTHRHKVSSVGFHEAIEASRGITTRTGDDSDVDSPPPPQQSETLTANLGTVERNSDGKKVRIATIDDDRAMDDDIASSVVFFSEKRFHPHSKVAPASPPSIEKKIESNTNRKNTDLSKRKPPTRESIEKFCVEELGFGEFLHVSDLLSQCRANLLALQFK